MNNLTIEELNSKTLTQLREIAKEMDIKSVSKYKKGELVEIINENTIKDTIKSEKKDEIKSEYRYTNVKSQDNSEIVNKSEKTYVKPYTKVENQSNGRYVDSKNLRTENRTQNSEYTRVQGVDNRQPRSYSNNKSYSLAVK